ncbi:MAG TPA: sodium transporter, partial [Agriterribacter sp.]|nr:sodium transporter [Agriterribacter sp.]
ATGRAALITAVITIPLSVLFKFWIPEVPFLNRMGIAFIILSIIMVTLSLTDSTPQKAAPLDMPSFRVSKGFLLMAFIICGILAALYSAYW